MSTENSSFFNDDIYIDVEDSPNIKISNQNSISDTSISLNTKNSFPDTSTSSIFTNNRITFQNDVDCSKSSTSFQRNSPVEVNCNFIQPYPNENVSSALKIPLKRKFPGPAGLLTGIDDLSVEAKKLEDIEIKSQEILMPKEFSCSQNTANLFNSPAWLRMCKDFAYEIFLPDKYNISWIKSRATAKKLINQKAPFLAAIVQFIEYGKTSSASLSLKDKTGEIQASMNKDVYEEYAAHLKLNSVIVLNQFSILTTLQGSRHYLIITGKNLVRIYNCCEENLENECLTKPNEKSNDVIGENKVKILSVQPFFYEEFVRKISESKLECNSSKYCEVSGNSNVNKSYLLKDNTRRILNGRDYCVVLKNSVNNGSGKNYNVNKFKKDEDVKNNLININLNTTRNQINKFNFKTRKRESSEKPLDILTDLLEDDIKTNFNEELKTNQSEINLEIKKSRTDIQNDKNKLIESKSKNNAEAQKTSKGTKGYAERKMLLFENDVNFDLDIDFDEVNLEPACVNLEPQCVRDLENQTNLKPQITSNCKLDCGRSQTSGSVLKTEFNNFNTSIGENRSKSSTDQDKIENVTKKVKSSSELNENEPASKINKLTCDKLQRFKFKPKTSGNKNGLNSNLVDFDEVFGEVKTETTESKLNEILEEIFNGIDTDSFFEEF